MAPQNMSRLSGCILLSWHVPNQYFCCIFLSDSLPAAITNDVTSDTRCNVKLFDNPGFLTKERLNLVRHEHDKSIRRCSSKHVKSKNHACTLCRKTFWCPSSLRHHQEKSHNMDFTLTANKDLVCEHCGKKYTQPHSLRKHEELHRREAISDAEDGRSMQNLVPFKHKDSLRPVLIACKRTYYQRWKKHACTLCLKSFWAPSSLRRHYEMEHSLDWLAPAVEGEACSICGKQYKQELSLRRHEKHHYCEAEAQAERQCTVCERLMSDKHSLKRHMLTHSGIKAFMCSMCGHLCTSKYELASHERLHTGEKRYECTKCNRRFGQIGELRYHEINYHCENPTMYVCSLCGHQFKHRILLKRHMQVHTGERPHKCFECDKTFRNRGQLTLHTRLHTGEKPHTCSECSKTFRLMCTLKRHLLIHKGKRPYSCPMCTKSFAQAGNMRTHLRTHTGEKPYECTACGINFSHSGTLKKHALSHTINQTS